MYQTRSVRFHAVLLILATFLSFSAGCSKEETLPVPRSLAGTEWEMKTEETTLVFRFLSENECTLVEQPATGGPAEYRYDYTYDIPDLTLEPHDENREILSGSVFRWNKKSIGMTLHAPDGTVVFQASKSIGSIWQ